MRETSVLIRLIKLRADLDLIIEKALDKANNISVDKDEWFESALEAKRWNNVRGHIEDAILEMELWSE